MCCIEKIYSRFRNINVHKNKTLKNKIKVLFNMFSIKVFRFVKHVHNQSTFNCCRKENINFLKNDLGFA